MTAITQREWEEAQAWERSWWSERTPEQIEHEKNLHIPEMRELQPTPEVKTIDIGSGPVSILHDLVFGEGSTALDPLTFDEKFEKEYEYDGIARLRIQVERLNPIEHGKFDQGLCYNVLQHVQNPERAIQAMVTTCNVVRLIEPTGLAPSAGHPHTITTELVVNAFMTAARQPWNAFPYKMEVRSGPVEDLGGQSCIIIFERRG